MKQHAIIKPNPHPPKGTVSIETEPDPDSGQLATMTVLDDTPTSGLQLMFSAKSILNPYITCTGVIKKIGDKNFRPTSQIYEQIILLIINNK